MSGPQPLRITQQRRLILEELKLCKSHPTADELYLRVRKRLPHIGLGTVYRNLETLAERGLIRKMEVGGTQRRFDGEVSEHHHVRCLSCGHVADAPTGKSLRGIEKAAMLDGYDVVGYRLELLGYCPRCRKKQASGPDRRA